MAKKKKKQQRKQRAWLIVSFIVIALVAYIIMMYMKQRQIEAAARTRYAAFGIDVPNGYEIHGIDVSKYQGFVYWPAVKKMQVDDIKLGFAFVKATEGLTIVDRQFKRNWQEAKQAGIARGAYHFFIASKSGKAQAQNFIKKVQLQSGDLPPVLDIEQLYRVKPEALRKEAMAFLKELEAYYKVRPIIYTNVSFYELYLGQDFDDYPLWVAHYFEPTKPRIGRSWLFWQYNDGGRVNGIVNKTDFNVFSADSAAFKNLLIK